MLLSKKCFTVALLALLSVVSASAAPRNRRQALEIAQQNAAAHGITMASDTRRRVAAQGEEVVLPYYIFNNGDDKGWTIVAGDDRVDEVIGYSDEGSMDEDQLPPAVKEMLDYYKSYIENLGDSVIPTANKAPRKAAATGTAAMGPYLTTRWDQYEPYYNLTPTQSGSHTATCCVATGFGQILYYLYRTQGGHTSDTFSSSIEAYSLSASGSYVKGDAVSGPRTYNWDKMLSDYKEEYTEEQATAVATLLRDIGSAVKVNYNTSVSITNSKYVSQNAAALFGLQSGSSYTYNSSMGASTWKAAVVGELGNYRPVLVASTGHAYVCDGYDGNGLYHFNFGYSGRGDGWYTFDAMNGYGQATWGYTTGLKLRASDTNVTKLEDICKTARAQTSLVPVGNKGGQLRSDLYNALIALVEQGEAAVANSCSTMTDTEVTDLCTQISQALIDVTMKRSPYPTGTYYVKTYTNYSDGNTKAMYASGTGVNWGTISTSSDTYKWHIEYDEATNAYKMYNVSTKGHFTSISTSTQAKLSTSSTTEVEVRPLALITRENKQVYAVTLRPMVSGYNTGFNYYCHQGSHSNGSGTGSTVVGWEPYSDYNQWWFDPIEVESTLESCVASFAQNSMTITVGDKVSNTLTKNSEGSVTYSSSNTSVATVNSSTGQVTAKAAGTATITATIAATSTHDTGKATFVVTVTALPVPTISFANSSVSVEMDKTTTNVATASSTGAITYASSNTSVATVDATTGVITGVNIGTATITATVAGTSSYSENSTTCTVTVVENSELRAVLNELLALEPNFYSADDIANAKASGSSVVGTTGLITASTQFSSPYTESSEGSFAALLDGSASTFWHSAWSSGSVSAGTHYFVVALNAAEQDSILLSMTRRSGVSDDHVTQFEVYGSNDNNAWTDITTLNFTLGSNNETVTTRFGLGSSYTYLKFVCTNTGSTGSTSCRGYFHMGEFQLYRITTVPADPEAESLIALSEAFATGKAVTGVRVTDITDLRTAIEAYAPKGDVNLDGKTDIADITWLIHILKGNTNVKHGITDINADYKTNVNDVNKPNGLVDIIVEKK